MMVKGPNYLVELTAVDKSSPVFRQVRSGLGDLRSGLDTVKGALAAVGVTVGVGAMVKLHGDILRATASLGDMSQRAGTSVAWLSKMQQVAKTGSHDFEGFVGQLGMAIKGLKSGDEEGQKAGKAFEFLDIKVKDSTGRFRDMGETTLELAQKLQKYEEGGNKVALVQDALGKGAEKYLPFLKDLSKETDLHAKVTAEQVERAEQAVKAMNRLQSAFGDTSRELTLLTAGPMTEFLRKVNLLIKLGGGPLGGLRIWMDEPMGDAFKDLGDKVAAADAGIAKLQKRERELMTAQGLQPGIDYRNSIEDVRADIETARKRRAYYLQILGFNAEGLAEDPSGNVGPRPADPLQKLAYESAGKSKTGLTPFEQRVLELRRQIADAESGKNEFVETHLEIQAGKYGKLIGAQKEQLLLLSAESEQRKGLHEFHKKSAEEAIDLAREGGEADKKRLDGLIELREGYLDSIDPMRKYQRELETIMRLEQLGPARGGLTPMQAAQARVDMYRRMDEDLKKHKQVTDEITEFWREAARSMQGSMSDLFFDAMQGELGDLGRNFKRTIDRMVADVLAAKAATKFFGEDFGKGGEIGGWIGAGLKWLGIGGGPVGNTLPGTSIPFADAFAGGMTPMAAGGVMTSRGPLRLNRYAMGGIADSPQVAVFGEGRTPEAYVPLPDGRRIPVQMKGDAPAPTKQLVVNGPLMVIQTPDTGGFRRSESQIAADMQGMLAEALRGR